MLFPLNNKLANWLFPLVRELASASCSDYPPCPCRILRRGFIAAVAQVWEILRK